MADLKLVGAVAIKVRPDAKGFRKDTQDQVKEELKTVKGTVPVEAEFKGEEAKKRAEKLEKDLDGKTVTWNVKLDHDSIKSAQKKLDSMLDPTAEIKFKVGDEKSIREAAARLEELAKKAKVKITYSEDEQGFQSVLAKIAALRREKLEKTIHIGTSDEELDKLEKDMKSKLAKIAGDKLEIKAESTIKLEYDENRESLQETLDLIDRELAKFKDQTFYVGADQASLIAARAAVQEAMDGLPVRFEYEKNLSSLEQAIKEIDAELDKVRPKLNVEALLDEESLLAARAKLLAEVADLRQTIEISYNLNRTSLQSAIDQINKALDDIHKVEIEIGLNEFELAWVKADLEAALAKQPVTLTYDNNKAGLQKAIAEIDALLAKNHVAKIVTTLDDLSLVMAKAKLEEELSHQTVSFEYEENLESVKAARAKIRALMSMETKLHIDAELNDESLAEALAKADALIESLTPEAKVKVLPEVSMAQYAKVFTELKALTKSQTVDILVRLNNAGILTAAAKLTGLRAAGRWTEAFAKSLGTLDRNLPILAAAVVGVNTLTSGLISLTASAFSLGNELGSVVRMAGLLAPALILGFAAVRTVMQGVFKDFGAAVNGDDKAIEKLTESGKKAAANMRVIFQDIRETVSKNFWAEASDNMLRFTEVALPSVRDGMAKLSTSMGGVFGSIVDATSKFAEEDGFLVFFNNLIRGFDEVKQGMAPFMSGFLNLAALGSTIFPRMGRAFEEMSGKFDAWVTGLAADGSFSRWVNLGIQGIKDLGSAGISLVGVWNNIGAAAQGAGALTLSSFARMMAKLEEVTAGYRFQTNLGRIFDGARTASDEFHAALGKLGPAMDVFSVTMGNALANSGKALAAFVGLLGDIMSSTNLDKGMTAFLDGVTQMFEELRPAAAPVTEILRTFGEILGSVARDSGPLFRNLFVQLASVFTAAWTALEPFLPALIQVGTSIVNIVGPALTQAAEVLIPAFASGLVDLGDGLIPVIKSLADFAAGVATMVADVPLPVIAGITGGVLALVGALQFSIAVMPVAKTALEAFGIMAGVTAARMQLMIPVVGIILAALTGLAIGGVAALATAQESGTPFANEYATALRQDAEAAGEFGTAIGTATTKMAIQKLMSEGVYDAAKNLGLGYQEVTDAVLKGGPAMDTLKGKLDTSQKGFDNFIQNARKSSTGWDDFQNKIKDAKLGTEQIDKIRKAVELNNGSIVQAQKEQEILNTIQQDAGIAAEGAAQKTDLLTEALNKQVSQVGAAASASSVLTDSFSSTASKVDAMRKTFEILVGKDAKQAAAETLGAYAKGFNDLKDTVTPLAGKMQELGDAVYGENGFLNVAGGNKAVLQVNQALVDQVDSVWAGAKASYDAAIKQGKTAQGAFEDAQKFIGDRKGDYDALAQASGVSAEKVQGQWEAVFGHEWVLRVSLSGATEAATRAQELVTSIGGSFDGKEFVAYLDANPDKAMLAIQDPVQAATDWMNHDWKAKLDALPDPAKEQLQNLKGLTEEEWNRGDFQAILRAAQTIPGLPEALVKIRNGASNNGMDWQAILKAIADGSSIEAARRAIDAAAAAREAWITIRYLDSGNPVKGAGQVWVDPMNSANGNILKFRSNIAYKAFANGGIERHVAQIARPGVTPRVWAEKETYGEAYIPYAQSKRPRSLAILQQVAKDFGYELSKASEGFANGGFAGHAGPSTTNSASVNIGNLYTVDADEAVRKIRNSQADALAVAGITLTGA